VSRATSNGIPRRSSEESKPAEERLEPADALQRHLRNEPTRVSKSRIKRLRGLSQPQYLLRVGEVRVFYDVTREAVEVLAIVTKAEAERWLAEHGTPSAPSSPG
jgi:mRNA interferase RelE/StbE